MTIRIPKKTIELPKRTSLISAARQALRLATLTMSTITLTFKEIIVMVTREMTVKEIRSEWFLKRRRAREKAALMFAAKQTLELAKRTTDPATLNFKGIAVTVTGGMNVDGILTKWFSKRRGKG